MKHFIISLLLLSFVAALVLVNGAYVRYTARGLLEQAKALDADSPDLVSIAGSFAKEWKNAHGKLGITVHECELERICEAVSDLQSAAERGDRDSFAKAKRRIAAALEELAESENADILNIF